MTFREGGAFDFHTIFEQIKERLHHAVAIAREEGRNIGSVGILGAADLAAVHLEQLPAYEPVSEPPTPTVADGRDPNPLESPVMGDSGVAGMRGPDAPKLEEDESHARIEPPNEPPPGYEEAQAQAVSLDFDRRLREEAERL
jgi:WW domain-binding protein 2